MLGHEPRSVRTCSRRLLMPKRKNQFLFRLDLGDGGSKNLAERRRDAPELRPSVRACRELALAAANEQHEALEELRAGYRARSAQGPYASLLDTWSSFHQAWFGNHEVLPLTIDKIEGVSAMAKRGGYRSWPNYLYRTKAEHIRSGHPWSAQLNQALTEAKRSVGRGLGPARQSAPLDVLALSKLDMDESPLVPKGPWGPKTMAIVSSLFMLREIEASLAKIVHVTIDETFSKVSILLPASKTDPKALSVTRTWSCVCRVAPNLCPVHLIAKHLKFLRSKMPITSCTPLFPAVSGETVDKQDVVKTVEGLAERLGIAVLDSQGNRRFGGHTFRVSGAQYLAGIGLGESLIALLARWMSPTVKRYMSESPLQLLGREFMSAFTSIDAARTACNSDAGTGVDLRSITSSLDELRCALEKSKLKSRIVHS